VHHPTFERWEVRHAAPSAATWRAAWPTGLRARQAERIAEQHNVDGRPSQSRAKARSRAPTQAPGDQRRQRERVGAMFAKLRTAKHLKATPSSAKATVEITGRAGRITAIHENPDQ
jgi:hypothetical protein